MDQSLAGQGKLSRRSWLSGSEMVILLFPAWLLIFYFRTGISNWIAEHILFLPENSVISNTLIFFLATLLKVFLLLVLIIFVMGVIRTWIPVAKIRKSLKKLPSYAANGLAGLLGVISPFCSCSAIPMFISFLEAGNPWESLSLS